MTNEQKQKVLQLLELCMDCNPDEAEVFFYFHPKIESVSLMVYFGGFNQGKPDETYDAYICLENGERRLDSMIGAIASIPGRARAVIEKKEAERRAKITKEYEELFNKSTATTA